MRSAAKCNEEDFVGLCYACICFAGEDDGEKGEFPTRNFTQTHHSICLCR